MYYVHNIPVHVVSMYNQHTFYFFDLFEILQAGHKNTCASSGNQHFFTKSGHCIVRPTKIMNSADKNWTLYYYFKWRILSRTGKIGSGKNTKYFFPTGLEVHLEDMF